MNEIMGFSIMFTFYGIGLINGGSTMAAILGPIFILVGLLLCLLAKRKSNV